MESTRLPGKVLAEIEGLTVVEHVINRVSMASLVDEVVVATPDNAANAVLRDTVTASGCRVVAGSSQNVLSRFIKAAHETKAKTVVRITADCPLIDPSLIDTCIQRFVSSDHDYVHTSELWPDGLDVEVFTIEALLLAGEGAENDFDREHVTPYIKKANAEASSLVEPPSDLPDIRITLDYPEDLAVISTIFQHFKGQDFGIKQIAALATKQPHLFDTNRHYQRNEGAHMSSGEKLYTRAKKVIPGGTMLLSKRPEMHAPAGWPSYFDRASGCHIWDLDGVKYTDVSWMGVGTNILGYANPKVDEAVKKTIEKGNLSTLNAPEEVELAELLCGIHPWADMARFTRSGGEAGAVAVRIARAASGRDHVAFCGYHGWHDWYLSANLGDTDALDGHLLPGLDTGGVPRHLHNTATPFEFNSLKSLRKVVSEHSSGVIYMEVERSQPPTNEFLAGVRKLADEVGAVLVFDECTSGFRSVLGGQHLKYGVNPDIVVLGKTLGNGYAINAIVGTRAVMEHAQDSFMSSTFWTERIGPTAALATLKEMTLTNAPQEIEKIGIDLQKALTTLGEKLNLNINVSGLPALTTFTVEGSTPQELRTLITREMLKKNMLGSTAVYVSVAHQPEVISSYLSNLEDILLTYKEEILSGQLSTVLPEGMVQQGFTRLA